MKDRGRHLDGLLFVMPFVALYLVLLIVPLIMGISLSFSRADLFGRHVFVGLENYARLAGDPVFHQAVRNTFILFSPLALPGAGAVPDFSRSCYLLFTLRRG